MIQEYFKDCRTEEELQKEHRKLVLQMHPDRNAGDPGATAKFQEMQAQYQEKLAELHGDYRAAAKGRERRAQAEREAKARMEREKRERRVEEVINQARRNKGIDFGEIKEGDYIYARRIMNDGQSGLAWNELRGEQIVEIVYRSIPELAAVVKIEKIFNLSDHDIMDGILGCCIDDIYGGYEVLQVSDSNSKGKRVAKVVMFRSPHFCFFGNPKGDLYISDYYVAMNYEDMFADQFMQMKQRDEEKKRAEAERLAKLYAEQESLIKEWSGKLVTISEALTVREKEAVSLGNLKKMLQMKFPKVSFRLKGRRSLGACCWKDGPTREEVWEVLDLFDTMSTSEKTPSHSLLPWQRHFGFVNGYALCREMSAVTKASILELLGKISDDFTRGDYYDTIRVSETDWMLLHLLVGVNVTDDKARKCVCVECEDGTRKVEIDDAVNYIFDRTSYLRSKKKSNKTRKAAEAA